ncbi:MAG: PE-PGRS family protein [bacterium]
MSLRKLGVLLCALVFTACGGDPGQNNNEERCGNGMIDDGETCDGSNLAGLSCELLSGFSGGALTCDELCRLDTSGCWFCGNGVREGGEACDGSDLGGESCQSVGDYTGGALACDESCVLDTSGCRSCGNGALDVGEECDDGNELAADGCDEQCAVEAGWSCVGAPSVCSALCGNDALDAGEECDGAELGGATCVSLGLDPGTLSCAGACQYDTSGCGNCSACPVDYWDLDGDPATGTCGCEYFCQWVSTDDPLDPSYVDENCDGTDGVVDECVFVSASLGAATGLGTPESPVATIAQGIQLADTLSLAAVCVSGESYDEQVTVVSGINLHGGFDQVDPVFPFRRTAAATTTVNSVGTVFYAAQIDLETHIDGFTINALTPPTPGESTYGVRLVSGTAELVVSHNVIHAAAGAAGDDGSSGTPHTVLSALHGNNGLNGCEGTGCQPTSGPQPACLEFGGRGGNGGYESGSGQNGSLGTGNTPVGLGGGTDACFYQSDNGTAGSPGGPDGGQGAAGGGGASLGVLAGGAYVPAAGDDGQPGFNGKGGSGGGGGGGGPTIGGIFCTADTGGGGGSGGCGGLGGDLGGGGLGGGGAFGVFAAAGVVTVTQNEITVVGGGAGGAGGDGVAGQLGGVGGSGGSSYDDSGAGGSGGAGSNAGAGGPGGGGGGGPSACLAYGSQVTYTFAANLSCTAGAPGIGGPGATNPQGGVSSPGLTGQSAATLLIN